MENLIGSKVIVSADNCPANWPNIGILTNVDDFGIYLRPDLSRFPNSHDVNMVIFPLHAISSLSITD